MACLFWPFSIPGFGQDNGFGTLALNDLKRKVDILGLLRKFGKTWSLPLRHSGADSGVDSRTFDLNASYHNKDIQRSSTHHPSAGRCWQVKSQRPDILVGWDAPGEEDRTRGIRMWLTHPRSIQTRDQLEDAGRPTLDYARQLLDLWLNERRGWIAVSCKVRFQCCCSLIASSSIVWVHLNPEVQGMSVVPHHATRRLCVIPKKSLSTPVM